MKRLKVLTILFVLVILCFLCCLYGEATTTKGMDVLNSYSTTFGDKTIQNISVVTNSEIHDFTECSQEIIQHCIANDFHTIQFSYDVHGYPVEVNARVYETEADLRNGKSVFSFSCVQESDTYEYNIVENLDKFEIVITEN